MTSHILVVGETQSGKTRFVAVRVHAHFPGLSVFFNTNHSRDVVGVKVHSVRELAIAVARGERIICFEPSEDLATQRGQLLSLKRWLFQHGIGVRYVWAQIVVDEGHKFVDDEELVDDIARRGMGAYGVRLVLISQYPTGIKPGTRTNLGIRIIFKPGLEGGDFLRVKGSTYPVHEILRHTAKKYAYAMYTPGRGWEFK